MAHFLVDTYRNQQEIDEVLDSIVGTSLWNQFAGRYYEVYGKEYQGEELDRMVKREILGKTLAQRFVPGMEQAVEDLTRPRTPSSPCLAGWYELYVISSPAKDRI